MSWFCSRSCSWNYVPATDILVVLWPQPQYKLTSFYMEFWIQELFFQFMLDFWFCELPFPKQPISFKTTFRCKLLLAPCTDGLFTQPGFDNWEKAQDKLEMLLSLFHQEEAYVLPAVTTGDGAPGC